MNHDEIWKDAYVDILETELPRDANIISSHVVKTDDAGGLKLKGRIVVIGIRDADKDLVRSDCAAADTIIVRL